MKDMEMYVIESAKERETSEQRRHRQRLEYRRRREDQYRNDKAQMTMAITCLILILVAILASIAVSRQTVRAVEAPPIKTTVVIPPVSAEEPDTSYRRDDIPLDYATQDLLHDATSEAGIPYELALAVISRETGYRNVIGDDGASTGYMQVQERWHRDRMDKLGVTDLSDPVSNFRVGCDFLGELLNKYPTEEALTAYNRGTPGKSEYASNVLKEWEVMKSEVVK